MEVARSMMFHTNVPKKFWEDARVSACYLINRLPTKILNDISPFEVLNNSKPSINHLRVFGYVCFVLIRGEQRNNLEAKSVKSMFIGYSTTQKGYKCFVPEIRKVLMSRDVKFVEAKGYYEEKNWKSLKDLSNSPSDRANNLRILLENLGVYPPPAPATPPAPCTPTPPAVSNENLHLDHDGGTQEEATEEELNNLAPEQVVHDQDEASQDQEEQLIALRRSTRLRKDPSI